MHIVLGILGAIITILILVKRLSDAGFSADSLNPFLWYRRHKWRQQYTTHPVYNIREPLEAAALLLVATVKCDGEISSEEKKALLHIFEEDFHRSQREASGLLTSSIHLLKDGINVQQNLEKILAQNRTKFSGEQIASTLDLMEKVAQIDGSPRELQKELIATVKTALQNPKTPASQWG